MTTGEIHWKGRGALCIMGHPPGRTVYRHGRPVTVACPTVTLGNPTSPQPLTWRTDLCGGSAELEPSQPSAIDIPQNEDDGRRTQGGKETSHGRVKGSDRAKVCNNGETEGHGGEHKSSQKRDGKENAWSGLKAPCDHGLSQALPQPTHSELTSVPSAFAVPAEPST